jgi:hypothetical protein
MRVRNLTGAGGRGPGARDCYAALTVTLPDSARWPVLSPVDEAPGPRPPVPSPRFVTLPDSAPPSLSMAAEAPAPGPRPPAPKRPPTPEGVS